MPRRGKRSTKSSRSKGRPALLELAPPVEHDEEPPAPAIDAGPAPDPLAELAAAEQLVGHEFPAPPPPPPPAEPPKADADEELAEGLEGLVEHAAEDPELLELLTAEEFADTWELVFGVVADLRARQHKDQAKAFTDLWELPPKSATRLGKWTYRVVKRHPELIPWLAKYLPDLVLGVLLIVELGSRFREDRKLARGPELVP